MADNDRFVIQKIQTNKKCFFREQDGIESHPRTRCLIDPQSYYYVFDSDCKKCEEGKTIEEYENMIAETLWNKHYKVYLKTYKEALSVHDSLIQCAVDTVHGLAKAVVDRLFGEGE